MLVGTALVMLVGYFTRSGRTLDVTTSDTSSRTSLLALGLAFMVGFGLLFEFEIGRRIK